MRTTRWLTTVAFAAVACLATAISAAELKIGTKYANSSLDPHYQCMNDNNSMLSHLYEGLVEFDGNLNPKPILAVSWKRLEPKVWEINLRKGVTFADGTPFVAEDVVFSWQRTAALTPKKKKKKKTAKAAKTADTAKAATKKKKKKKKRKLGCSRAIGPIKDISVVDDHKIRITTKKPFPLLMHNIDNMRILSKKVHGKAKSSDFNSGKLAFGTGPYRLVEWNAGQNFIVKRRDDYKGGWGKQPWEKVTFVSMRSNPARTAALLAGDVDIADLLTSKDLPLIREGGKFSVFTTPAARSNFIHFDHMRDDTPFVWDHSGKKLKKNPFKDIRVRQALTLAIDKQAIVDKVLGGMAEAVAQLYPSALPGASPKLKVEKQDYKKAKKLMAEAGYPKGFKTRLIGTKNRYPGDAESLQIIKQYWARIGVVAEVEVLPSSIYFKRRKKYEYSVFYAGGSGFHAMVPLGNVLGNRDLGYGRLNWGRYGNSKFDEMFGKALTINDEAKRDAAVGEAMHFVMQDYPVIPLYSFQLISASRKDKVGKLVMIGRQRTVAMDVLAK